MALRKRNYSVYEISQALKEQGTPLSATAVREVLAAEGFAPLPRRLDEERPGRVGPSAEAVANVGDFTLSSREFTTRVGGLFLFIADLVRIDTDALALAAKLPGSRMIPAAHALRAALALKLWSIERKSHIMALVADEGLALFCGLNAMPKKSFLSEYSSRITRQTVSRLLASWHTRFAGDALFTGESLNLDFHSVPYFGEHPLVQSHVADKANEIVAIPKLLDLLAIEGAIVTLDAIGCQRAIAQQILDKKADYVLALKGNQGTLREDVELFAAEQKANGFKDAKISRHQTVDGDHGRIETRTYTAIHDVAWLQERHGWPGLQGVIMVESTREIADKIERETRFYITSLVWLASQLGPVIRSHWAIENSLHWVMDMIFRDDECRIRTDHAPANFTTIKHMAQNLIRKAPGKDSLRLRRKTAAWDDDFLASLLAA